VTVGKRYRMDDGEIEVDAIVPITYADITPEIARASGFKGVVDLLKVAKHGRGDNVYLVRFHYVAPAGAEGLTRSVAAHGRAGRAERRTKSAAARGRAARPQRLAEDVAVRRGDAKRRDRRRRS
jgi:hypothetical protein